MRNLQHENNVPTLVIVQGFSKQNFSYWKIILPLEKGSSLKNMMYGLPDKNEVNLTENIPSIYIANHKTVIIRLQILLLAV